MLSIDAINYYEEIYNHLINIEDIITYIEENSPGIEKGKILEEILESKYIDNTTYGNIYSAKSNENLSKIYINKFNKFKSGFNLKEFYGKISLLDKDIKNIFEKYNHKDKNVLELLDSLDILTNLYTNLQQNDKKGNIILFFESALTSITQYNTVLNSTEEFINALTYKNAKKINKNSEELEIQLLSCEYNVGEFGDILQNLETAYSKLVMLSPNPNIKKLQIIKIESGSLLAKILGDKNIIEALGRIFNMIIDQVYYNYTKVGKLELNSKMMKNVSEHTEVLKGLEEIGVDIKEGKQNISDTLNVTTKNLYEIVSKAPRIKINKEEKSVENEKLYLENSVRMLAEANDDYTNLKLKDLKAIAKSRKIKGYSTKSKDQLIKILNNK